MSGLVAYRADDLSAVHAISRRHSREHRLQTRQSTVVVLHRHHAAIDDPPRGDDHACRRGRDGGADLTGEIHPAMTRKPRLERNPGELDDVHWRQGGVVGHRRRPSSRLSREAYGGPCQHQGERRHPPSR